MQMGKPTNQSRAIKWLELIKHRPIHKPRNHFAHFKWFLEVYRRNPAQFFHIVKRLGNRLGRAIISGAPIQIAHNLSRQTKRMVIIISQMIGNPGKPCMNIAPAQFFSANHFPGSGLHQRRPGEKNRSLLAHNHRFVRHGRHISPACGAGAMHDGNLRNSSGRHLRLIIKNPPKMFFVGKNLVLQGQKSPAGFNQIQAGQAVFQSNFLPAQMLLNRHRMISAAFNRGVIGNNHAGDALNLANAGNDASTIDITGIHIPCSKLANFQKCRTRINEPIDACARQQLAAFQMPCAIFLTATASDNLRPLAQCRKQPVHSTGIGLKALILHTNHRCQNRHLVNP